METTEELLNEIKCNKNYIPFEARGEVDVSLFLNQELKNINLREMFYNLDIDPTNGYKYINGKRKMCRDQFLKILIYLKLDLEQIQTRLKHYEFPMLYAKNKRDAAIIYCIYNKYSYKETKRYLKDNGILGL